MAFSPASPALLVPSPVKGLPPLRNTVDVWCSACAASYVYGDTGRAAYFDFTDSTGTVRRYRPAPGTPCCGARARVKVARKPDFSDPQV